MRRLICLLVLLLAAPALANDSEFYGSGADVYPVQNDHIQMARESLHIEQLGPHRQSYVERWGVHVRYEFVNTHSAPVTVQMGFPEHCQRTVDDMEVVAPSCKVPAIKDFQAWVDDAKVPVTVKTPTAAGALPDAGYDRVHTFQVSFKAGERKVVEHRYTHGGRIVSPFHSAVEYILKTGALWKGPIGELDIRIVLKAEWADVIDQSKTLPKPDFQGWQGGTYQLKWALKGFEPKGDIDFLLQEPKGYEARSDFNSLMSEALADPKALAGKSKAELRILRNTPYALLGYTFKSQDLTDHFTKQGWYRPRLDFDPNWLSKDEVKFVALVKGLEKKAK
ncbi:MAG: YARHG domain-containing protein [Myxococcales bacterium]|nr:YARHG domain-containing protein [Myxococcales bacterium]MCB9523016.1 YARHG domain-containing protein [Myxococcales bacterium]